jgi:thioesterase domain-containing protein
MSVSSRTAVNPNTSALFARASRNSERAIVAINNCALNSDTRAPAFYCVHSASGVAGTDFLDLARRLDPSIRFYGIQAPPKQMSEIDFGESIESIAAYYAEALVNFQPTGTFLLGGYCVGAVIALATAENLRARGREVGPLFAIDGVPENTSLALRHWKLRYWLEMAGNVPGWIRHADLIRRRSVNSLIWSIANNASAIGRAAMGLKRGQRLGGEYAIEGIMDVSRYQPAHRSFVNRLFKALFTYAPKSYSGDVVVYEATVKPLLYMPQIGRIWQEFAPQAKVAQILGTHIGMMHEPYVEALAKDLLARIADFSESYSAR